jgi:F420-0:gamma-glutamyl ligase-like protein
MRKALKISKYIPSSSQAKLNLFVTEQRVSLAREHALEPLARQVLLAILGVLIFAYLYFVAASIFHIMARKEASADTSRMQSAIAQMESEYFALSHALEPESGAKIGLAPVSGTDYVYRPGNAASAAARETDRIGGNEI